MAKSKRKTKRINKFKFTLMFIIPLTVIITLTFVGLYKHFTEIKPQRESMIEEFFSNNNIEGHIDHKFDNVYIFINNKEEYRVHLDKVVWYSVGNIKKVEKVEKIDFYVFNN